MLTASIFYLNEVPTVKARIKISYGYGIVLSRLYKKRGYCYFVSAQSVCLFPFALHWLVLQCLINVFCNSFCIINFNTPTCQQNNDLCIWFCSVMSELLMKNSLISSILVIIIMNKIIVQFNKGMYR